MLLLCHFPCIKMIATSYSPCPLGKHDLLIYLTLLGARIEGVFVIINKKYAVNCTRKFVPIPLAAVPWDNFSMMLWDKSSKLQCFSHFVAGRWKQEARRMSPKSKYFSLSYFNLSIERAVPFQQCWPQAHCELYKMRLPWTLSFSSPALFSFPFRASCLKMSRVSTDCSILTGGTDAHKYS